MYCSSFYYVLKIDENSMRYRREKKLQKFEYNYRVNRLIKSIYFEPYRSLEKNLLRASCSPLIYTYVYVTITSILIILYKLYDEYTAIGYVFFDILFSSVHVTIRSSLCSCSQKSIGIFNATHTMCYITKPGHAEIGEAI